MFCPMPVARPANCRQAATGRGKRIAERVAASARRRCWRCSWCLRVAQRGESRISGRRPEQAVTAADHVLSLRDQAAPMRGANFLCGAATGRGVAIDPCVHDRPMAGAPADGGFRVEADDELVIRSARPVSNS